MWNSAHAETPVENQIMEPGSVKQIPELQYLSQLLAPLVRPQYQALL